MNPAPWIGTLVALVLAVAAPAQDSSSSAPTRQSRDDAWWTGPMLAPNASTLPRGHVLVEPYLFDVISQGTWDYHGEKHSTPHSNTYGSLTYINYGLTNRLTVGVIPTAFYTTVTGGPSSSGPELGDLTVQAQFGLSRFREGRWLPTTSVVVQESLPTGEYDHLTRATDGVGAGTYTTTLGFYSQTFFWMPNGRILRARLNFTQAFSRGVDVRDASVYGTPPGFVGHASPGPAFSVDGAAEYSITRRWVAAMDLVYRHGWNTQVSNAGGTITVNFGSNDLIAVAPAVEYNFSSKVGLLLGTRIYPKGWNTGASITPAVAINFVH